MMTKYTDIILTVISVLVIPGAAAMIRLAIKWAGVEDKLSDVADDIEKLVKDKDRTHTDIVNRMNTMVDRLDNRVRYLEERVWNRGYGGSSKGRGDPPNHHPPIQYRGNGGDYLDDASPEQP